MFFFNGSTKRFSLLKNRQQEIENALQLTNLSKTRWTNRAESLKSVATLFEVIVEVPEEYISNETFLKTMDKKVQAKILGLYKRLLTADFIISMFFMKTIMYKLRTLTTTLESTKLNILDVITIIKTCIRSFENIRQDETEIENLINAAASFCRKLNIDVEADYVKHHRRRLAPRRYDESRDNAAELQYKQFYKMEFSSVLDTLLSWLNWNL